MDVELGLELVKVKGLVLGEGLLGIDARAARLGYEPWRGGVLSRFVGEVEGMVRGGGGVGCGGAGKRG